jgi:hypothetical protein
MNRAIANVGTNSLMLIDYAGGKKEGTKIALRLGIGT